MPRRILLLITDLEIGGTPTVLRELATRLNDPARGVEVEVASLKDLGPVGAELAAQGIPVTALNATSPLSLPLVARRLRRLIRERGIDTVVSFLVHANVVAALAVPRAVRLIDSIQTTQPHPRWHWRAQRWAARRAERIVVPSASVADAGEARSGIPPAQFEIIPNAVDPDAFPRSPVPAAPPADYPIGFIGRLDPVKRVPDLIDAVVPIGDRVTLDIFGDGADRERIERHIKSVGAGNVALHGAIRRPQDALANLGMLVLPSEAEGFGLVLIEAMAAGVPVVATNAPGIRNVVTHGSNGLLVPVARPDELTRAITRVIDGPDLRARLIENGLRTVREKFSWSAVLPQYRELLRLP
jgi:glycosyltransferase involved in cell wall biosynthesis